MKKILLLILTLVMFVACRKAEEIKESVTSPSVTNKTAVSIELIFNGGVVLIGDTLSQHLNEFQAKITYSDNSTSTFTPTEDILSGWDSSTAKQISVQISKDGLIDTVDINITAVPKTIVGINLLNVSDGQPFISWGYNIQDEIQYFQIEVFYSDGSTELIQPTEDMLSGWIDNDTNDPIDSDITATYEGFTDTLEVTFGANG